MSGTIVRECTCKSEYQDERYGKRQRVQNLSGDRDHSRCTVCKIVKAVAKSDEQKGEKKKSGKKSGKK